MDTRSLDDIWMKAEVGDRRLGQDVMAAHLLPSGIRTDLDFWAGDGVGNICDVACRM